MGRNRKKKKKTTTQTNTNVVTTEEGSKAREVIRQQLRERLRTRRNMMRTARRGGTRQEVQDIMNKFNEDDEGKAELMREIHEDVKGMKKKESKRYLKQMMSGMNKEQLANFKTMMKEKMPHSAQTGQVMNFVDQQEKKKEKEEALKPKVNPKTVYRPFSELSAEEKQKMREERPKKKKKTFKKADIRIPKMNEMKEMSDTLEDPADDTFQLQVPLPKKKKKHLGVKPSEMKDIRSIFTDSQILPFGTRLKNLKDFAQHPSFIHETMRATIVQNEDEDETVTPLEMEWFPITETVMDPNTKKDVTQQMIRLMEQMHPMKTWVHIMLHKPVKWSWFKERLKQVGIVFVGQMYENGQRVEYFDLIGLRPEISAPCAKITLSK